jgi:hypothetical protein
MKLDSIDEAICLTSPSSMLAHRELIEDRIRGALEPCHLQVLQDELEQMIAASTSPGEALCQMAELLSDRLDALGDLSAQLTILLDEQAAAIGCGAKIQQYSESHRRRTDGAHGG